MPNIFIKLVDEYPAEFSFGVIGVPMGLAAANVAKPLGNLDFLIVCKSLGLLAGLSLQFIAVILVSVYVLDKALTLWEKTRGRLCFLFTMLFTASFALALIVVSIIPQQCAAYLMSFCTVFPCFSISFHAKDLKEDVGPLFLLLGGALIAITTTIIISLTPRLT